MRASDVSKLEENGRQASASYCTMVRNNQESRRNLRTGTLACPFARLLTLLAPLAPLTHSLAPSCSLRSRAPRHSLTPELVLKWLIRYLKMTWFCPTVASAACWAEVRILETRESHHKSWSLLPHYSYFFPHRFFHRNYRPLCMLSCQVLLSDRWRPVSFPSPPPYPRPCPPTRWNWEAKRETVLVKVYDKIRT